MASTPTTFVMPEVPGHIASAVAALGNGPLTEDGLRSSIFPLFSRVLERREIYLANHSLGRPLDSTVSEMGAFAALWADQMDDAWGPWMEMQSAFRARIGATIGLSRPDATVPRPGAGQGLRSVLNALPPARGGARHRVLTTRAEFDSIDFILKTYAHQGRAEVEWVPTRDDLVDQDELINAIRGSRAIDLVVFSHVVFATGQFLDRAAEIVRAAHDAGALCLIDMYHSAGVVPVDLESLDADFAIGGSYKYFRGGPGAGWLAIHPRHLSVGQPTLRTLDTGWFAKRDTFGFQRTESPQLASGGDAWLECTPPIATMYQANAGLALLLAIGIERLRAYSVEQQAHLADALAAHGVQTRLLPSRGAFLLVPSRDAFALSAALKRAGLSTDARGSHVRLCPDILNTREELTRAADIIARVSSATEL